ncbi:MAG: VWA domain-containing protein [Pseudomonadota bacterium]
MRRKRRSDIFNLSFLDCMSCGFGAVILFFMIINATVARNSDAQNSDLMSETDRLEIEVLEGRKDLVKIRNVFENLENERVETDGKADRVQTELEILRELLAEFDADSLARRESIEQLKSDIKKLEEEKIRLLAAGSETEDPGNNVRKFVGDGDRQYLTGLRVGGDRALVLVDRSTSMLDKKLVNILRKRNLPLAEQLRSAKWRQVVASVDWITAQFRPNTQYQVYMFNDKAEPVIAGSDGVWLDVDKGDSLGQIVRTLRRTQPTGGTNLQEAMRVIEKLNPRPDNVYLLIDSLPTQGDRGGSRRFVSGAQRQTLLNDAARGLPSGIPVNILLYPMEGDYHAAIEYWKLAYRTGGSFMSVSQDWP